MDNLSGQTIKGYELRERIGAGGFGAVYRAYQAAVKREVAIKVILPERANNPDFIRRFEGEAQLIARMESPYIVPLYDFWRDAQGAFLVMRLLPSSLRKALQQGAWNVDATARLLDQIAGALSVAHRAGIVHRDIKPDNILLDDDSNAYLTDFGIAKDLGAEEMTQEGLLVGSPAYLTPEQIRGERVTPATDIYSLGLVIYELLSGSKPYPATTPAELLHQHLNEPLPALNTRRDSLPAAVNEVLQTATAKAPGERYGSALRFAEAFRAALPVAANGDVQPLADPLTERERSILVLMVEGLSNKDIAARLYLTLGTVRWYVQQIYTKLDAHSRQQAIRRARKLKLVTPVEGDTNMQTTTTNIERPAAAPGVARATKALTAEQRNRQRMLDKVRTFWIEGVLDNSLHDAALIDLGMKPKPEAVERAWDIVLQHPEQPNQALPPGTRIGDVFDELDGELLILGEPGSGKTTTLLELARDLLAEAQADERQPMPVVFNLSSWSASRKPIPDWLIDELNTKYQIPRKVGQGWVEADQILPLLDGLDEVKQEQRAACVEAINRWRQEHGFLPVAVCSRSTDYEALSVRLRLRSAIVLQPLTLEQIDRSLAQAPEDLRDLRAAIRTDASLRSLLQTPLMLSIVTLTYRDLPDKAIFTSGTPEERNAQLFDTYIAHTLKRRGKNQPYAPEQTVRWLSWLAAKQAEHGQTMFHIERLQPQWLDTPLQRALYAAGVGLVPTAVTWLVLGPDPVSLPWATTIGLFAMIVVWLSLGRPVGGALELSGRLRLPVWLNRLVIAVVRGVLAGLLSGLIGAFAWALSSQTSANYLRWAPVYGPLLGFTYGLIDGLTFRRRYPREADIKVAEVLNWSWRQAARGIWRGALIGAIAGTASSLLTSHELFWVSLWPMLPGAVLGGALGGIVSTEVATRTTANEGIHRSARNAIRIGLIGAVLTWLYVQFATDSPVVFYTITVGLLGWLSFGGMAVIKHILLRSILHWSGVMPWNYAAFLDYASERILLRKVGGGYVFVHRLLLEHFAALAPGLAFQKRKQKHLAATAGTVSQPALEIAYSAADGERPGEPAPMRDDETVIGAEDLLAGTADLHG